MRPCYPIRMSGTVCRICGRTLPPCISPYPENLDMPVHCRAHHEEALQIARGEAPADKLLPPPHGKDYDAEREKNKPWEVSGEALRDPRDRR